MASNIKQVDRISLNEILERQIRTRELTNQKELDALIVVGRSAYDRPGHLAYLTNHFPPFPSTPFTETDRGMGYGILFLPIEGTSTLLVDQPSEAALRKDLVAVDEVQVAPDMISSLISLLETRKVQRLGIAGEDLLPATIYRHLIEALPKLHTQTAEKILNIQRLIKSEAEISLLAKAAKIAEVGHQAALQILKPGVRENEICAAGTAGALQAGADFVRYFRVSSDPEVATTMRWPQASNRVIQAGEIVMMDIIGAYQGYQFDVFRAAVAGEPNQEKRRLLEAVVQASEASVAATQAGVSAEDLVKVAQDIFQKGQYVPYSRSFMGHGIGLETVEPPLISPGDHTILQPQMVLCIEPGLRIPGIGGCCIEQEVVVRETGPELLTEFPIRLW